MLFQSTIWINRGQRVTGLVDSLKLPAIQQTDIWEHSPTENSSISIQVAQELNSWLALMPYESDAKLAVIWQADKLTIEAQNCLLKSLEEPPPKSIIVLATCEPLKLLPTILSRCRLEYDLDTKGSTDEDWSDVVKLWQAADYLAKLNLIQLWLKDKKRSWFSQFTIKLLEQLTLEFKSINPQKLAKTDQQRIALLKQIYLGLEHNANLQPSLETLALCY